MSLRRPTDSLPMWRDPALDIVPGVVIGCVSTLLVGLVYRILSWSFSISRAASWKHECSHGCCIDMKDLDVEKLAAPQIEQELER